MLPAELNVMVASLGILSSSSLKNLSLVSRSWRAATGKALFKAICLKQITPAVHGDHAFLATWAQHVESLTYHFNKSHSAAAMDHEAVSDYFATVLRTCPRVAHIAISLRTSQPNRDHRKYRAFIRALANMPRLQHLSFVVSPGYSTSDFLSEFLPLANPTLRMLHISAPFDPGERFLVARTLVALSFSHLRILHLDARGGMSSLDFPFFRPPSIEHLVLVDTSPRQSRLKIDVSRLLGVTRAFADTLTSLTLQGITVLEGPSHQRLSSALPLLHKLAIHPTRLANLDLHALRHFTMRELELTIDDPSIGYVPQLIMDVLELDDTWPRLERLVVRLVVTIRGATAHGWSGAAVSPLRDCCHQRQACLEIFWALTETDHDPE